MMIDKREMASMGRRWNMYDLIDIWIEYKGHYH
jgi:hypothetical protein